MGSILGLGVRIKNTEDNKNIIYKIKMNIKNYNYLVIDNINKIPNNVQEGLIQVKKNFNLDILILLTTKDSNPYSFEIEEEIVNYFYKGKETSIFDVFEIICKIIFMYSNTIYFYFATEWYKDNVTRYLVDNQNGFIKHMKTPCNWTLTLYSPENHTWICDDEYPLIYEVNR